MTNQWDERYRAASFYYGTEPNDFLRASAARLAARGRVLCLGEGEGRNAVFLATLGHDVTAVDGSAAGLDTARRFAATRGTSIRCVVADLADYAIEPGAWDGIVSIWCHLAPQLRTRVHRACVAGLRGNGLFILEAYTPRQLAFGTGGPKDPAMLPTLGLLRAELAGLELLHAMELERVVHEGQGHNGQSAVVQILGRRAA
jgi:SAM-dependent methyltransferase